MMQKDLIGVWELVEFKITWDDLDEVVYPYGEDGIGYLIYTDCGHMSVQFMRAHRQHCLINDYNNVSISEKIEIGTNFGGYAGTYEVRANHVVHYPKIASFPNFINITQVREFKQDKDILTLECLYPVEKQGKAGLSRIVWKKLSGKG